MSEVNVEDSVTNSFKFTFALICKVRGLYYITFLERMDCWKSLTYCPVLVSTCCMQHIGFNHWHVQESNKIVMAMKLKRRWNPRRVTVGDLCFQCVIVRSSILVRVFHIFLNFLSFYVFFMCHHPTKGSPFVQTSTRLLSVCFWVQSTKHTSVPRCDKRL